MRTSTVKATGHSTGKVPSGFQKSRGHLIPVTSGACEVAVKDRGKLRACVNPGRWQLVGVSSAGPVRSCSTHRKALQARVKGLVVRNAAPRVRKARAPKVASA